MCFSGYVLTVFHLFVRVFFPLLYRSDLYRSDFRSPVFYPASSPSSAFFAPAARGGLAAGVLFFLSAACPAAADTAAPHAITPKAGTSKSASARTSLPASSSPLARFPSLLSTLHISGPVDFCGEPVPLNDPEIRERLEKEMLLMLWNRAQVILWVKRSGKYFPHIESVLKQRCMPDDLKYIPVIESALLPHIGSSKGAIGYWQFIRPTAKRYGLEVTDEVDERRNIVYATDAATRYLADMHAMFSSWTLAAAGYNMGEDRLKQRMNEQASSDFYRLYLSLETQRYVLRIIAAKLIFTHLKQYGFHFRPGDYWKPAKADRVAVNFPKPVPIMSIAQAASTTYKTIKDLNPEIRGSHFAAGPRTLRVPSGAGIGFPARLAARTGKNRIYSSGGSGAPVRLRPNPKSVKKARTYTVRRGDYAAKIAKNHGVSLADFLRWNRLRMDQPLYPGMKLKIYY
ncbi:MAG: lytic transglycosylase [Desulfobacterales bacterium]|nr:MAG: lytic transglycosylase [Desulfobacterales bacterium]